jgi:hypothetical protein
VLTVDQDDIEGTDGGAHAGRLQMTVLFCLSRCGESGAVRCIFQKITCGAFHDNCHIPERGDVVNWPGS